MAGYEVAEALGTRLLRYRDFTSVTLFFMIFGKIEAPE
jgi:hypothetical protein